MTGGVSVVGIYMNGNGKHQYVLDYLKNNYDKLNLSKTARKEWDTKSRRYDDFFKSGRASRQLVRAALDSYDNVGSVEVALAHYLEEDMDLYLEKIQRIANL